MTANRDSKFKIGLVQTRCSPDSEANLQRAITGIREAAEKGAEIICLQELFRSQYFCREENAALFSLAETIPGPSTEALGAVAKSLGVSVVASLFEKRAQGLYHNTAAIIDADGSLAGIYRKMHIPDDPLYLREVLFHSGRSRVFEFRDALFAHRRACVLGSVVSGRRAAHQPSGRECSVLSNRDRLASFREGAAWRSAARRLAHYSTRARDRQWSLCRCR